MGAAFDCVNVIYVAVYVLIIRGVILQRYFNHNIIARTLHPNRSRYQWLTGAIQVLYEFNKSAFGIKMTGWKTAFSILFPFINNIQVDALIQK